MATSILTLNFGCPGFTTAIETPKGTFVEKYKSENGKMILSPTYLICYEGCEYKFSKIK
ncbi:hypothetical protein [Flavobacterium sp. KJJ]|uniref:hypothetical protein n=1 Tax=Flavobacterium sp. KJJ TaxID=1270193 RepID=UPI000A546AFD|nr:hypothetical protein [Flavobacterium sp. KJJ]